MKIMRLFSALLALGFGSAVFGQTAPVPPGGRITINPGIAEMRADIVSAGTIYYAPSGMVSPQISVYDGVGFTAVPIISSFNDAVGLALPLNPAWATPLTIFDAYVTSNPPILCAVPWSAAPSSHRVVPQALAGGFSANAVATPCQGPSGVITMPQYQGVYIGKFYTNAAGRMDFKFGGAGAGGVGAVVSISNAYNKVDGAFVVQDTNWIWSPQTTPNVPSNISGWEPLDLACAGCSGGQHNTITMLTEGDGIKVSVGIGIYPRVGANLYVGVGIDTATAAVAGVWSKCKVGVGGPTGTSQIMHGALAECSGYLTEGLHVLQAMELGTSGTASGDFISDQGGVTQVGGMIANFKW